MTFGGPFWPRPVYDSMIWKFSIYVVLALRRKYRNCGFQNLIWLLSPLFVALLLNRKQGEGKRNNIGAATVEMLVLTATEDCLHGLMCIVHLQTGKYFSRYTVWDSETHDELDWMCIFHPLTFRRSNCIWCMPDKAREGKADTHRQENLFFPQNSCLI